MRRAVIIIFCILGLIVGVMIGDQLSTVSGLSWLGLGTDWIGFDYSGNIEIIKGSLGFWFRINICGVLGLILFALLAKWVTSWLKL